MLINGVPAMAKAAGKALRAVIKNGEKPEHIADDHSTTDLNTIIKTRELKTDIDTKDVDGHQQGSQGENFQESARRETYQDTHARHSQCRKRAHQGGDRLNLRLTHLQTQRLQQTRAPCFWQTQDHPHDQGQQQQGDH